MSNKTTARAAKIVALLQEKVRLDPWHRRLFYLVFGVLWLSGGVWLLAEWLKAPEIGPVRTPLQTLSMKVHGAAMLVFIAMLGSLFVHVRRGLALKTNRFSGWLIIGINGVLALSGWLLYYVTDDTARAWSSVIHWAIGIAALPALYTHILLGRASTVALSDKDKAAGGRSIRKARDAKSRGSLG